MADNYLITGYHGVPHVTAENDRGINAGIFGTGRFVLPVGEQFRAEYIGNNTIRLYDGKLVDNGAAAGIPAGRYVDLTISNAGQGMKRNDLIVFQYEKDVSTLIETGSFVVIQGAETSGTATDPVLTQADLLAGEAVLEQFALWRVSVASAAISAPVKLFTVAKNLTEIPSLATVTPVESGGTGAKTAKAARENLGVPGKSTLVTGKSISTTWTGDAAPYTQTISVDGVTANSVVEISLTSTATAEQVEAFQSLNLQDGGQAAGSITLRAFGTVNTVAIPINVVVRGDL